MARKSCLIFWSFSEKEHKTHFCIPLSPVFTRASGDGPQFIDEPTASLDPVAEAEMYRTFAAVLQKKGCILISHRLASAKMADQIYVLKDGVVAEKGSHEELLARGGLYASMFRSQSSWYQEQGGEVKGA